MAHQYSQVGFKLSVEVNEVNLSLSYGGVEWQLVELSRRGVLGKFLGKYVPPRFSVVGSPELILASNWGLWNKILLKFVF